MSKRQEEVGHLEPKFQGNGSSLGNIFWFLKKLDTFCYPTVFHLFINFVKKPIAYAYLIYNFA